MAHNSVTAIIPAHEAGATLARAVRSVQAQTFPVSEIIIVDDHSTDDTELVAQQLSRTDGRVRLVKAQGRGAGHARNRGVQEATGELIAFLDSDDVWYPTKLEAQLPLLGEDVAFVGALVHYLGEDGSVLGTYLPFDDWDAATASLRRAETMPVSLAFALMERAVFLESGGFDESFMRTQDLELAQRLVADGSRRVVWPKSRALGGYVLHGGGVSARSYAEQFLAAELVRARVRGATDVSYAQWQREPQLTPAARRALRAGEHYRLAAVSRGRGELGQKVVHGIRAVTADPRGTVKKLRGRSRHRGLLVPRTPPPEVAREFAPGDMAGEPPATLEAVPTVTVGGLRLAQDPVLLSEVLVTSYARSPRTLVLLAAHVTSLNAIQDPSFAEAFNAADAAHVDGISWSILARAQGTQAHKMATSDLAPEMLTHLATELGRPVRLAVLGGPQPDGSGTSTAQRAGEHLEERLPVEVVAVAHGFQEDWGPTLERVRLARPDAVLVGLGMPTEAFWAKAHRGLLPPALVITCGGWLRVLAGEEVRAHPVLQGTSLEWTHRLVTDPRRTLGRYARGSLNLVRHSLGAVVRRAVRNV